ncbi:hypothetical protein [Aminobacter sp. MDW-2]|uniref:hypothetical protein n=1 Tax=Aminobacter sp. MDW-2 TaxID=2666139 RepID=UPI0012AFD531|nr:hypothetical protein [Aminobacter sp. MDW-2]MRX33207.1 hypothetical protein [Aminobacter sp. MDW-2]QNH36830.1 hypothetical protein H5P29_13550 [Aminobacter sp. MDW-2]
MSRGGNRPGAGRKRGAPNKASVERQKKVAATGDTPLDYMLKVMRNPKADASRRDDMAKAAAPYVHPKLASMQHSGPRGGPIPVVDLTKLSGDELDQLESIFGPLAGPGDDDAPDQAGEGA